MNLIKWDPFTELEDVSKRLNRIFGQPLARTGTDNEMLAVADWAPSLWQQVRRAHSNPARRKNKSKFTPTH